MSTTPRFTPLAVAVLLTGAAVLGACSGSDGTSTAGSATTPSTDRQEVVTEVVDSVIGPTLRDAAMAVEAAAAAAAAYCAEPTVSSREEAIAAVDHGIVAYERMDPVDMGPIMVQRTDGHVTYPLDADRVEEIIAGGAATDADSVQDRTPSSARGLTAAEYLLTTEPAPASDPQRCAYLVAVSADAARAVDEVVVASFDGGEASAFFERLAGRADDAEPATQTIDVIVNMAMTVLDTDAGLLADPGDQTEAAVRRATTAHVATIAALWGDGSSGLSRLVDADLATRVADELAEAEGALADAAVPGSEALAAVEAARATIGTEVVAALDVVVGFSENDGDS